MIPTDGRNRKAKPQITKLDTRSFNGETYLLSQLNLALRQGNDIQFVVRLKSDIQYVRIGEFDQPDDKE